MADYSNVSFKNNGKLKLHDYRRHAAGDYPAVRRHQKDATYTLTSILVHTGQNYDYNAEPGVFSMTWACARPDFYLDAVGDGPGRDHRQHHCRELQADGCSRSPTPLLVLGDTNSCLSVIGAKRLHIPIFHMEAGNRCKDECLPEETNRRIVDHHLRREHVLFRARPPLSDRRAAPPKERTYVTGSPMAEVLHANLAQDRGQSDVLRASGAGEEASTSCSPPTARKTSTPSRILPTLFTAINHMAEKYDMPILYSCHPRSRKRLEQSGLPAGQARHSARAAGLPRLQLLADERLLRR